MEVVDDIPAADIPDVVRAEVVGELADDDRVEQSAWTEGTGHHMAGDRAEVPVDEDAVESVTEASVDHDDAEPSDGFVNEIRPDEVPADLRPTAGRQEPAEPAVPAAPSASTSEGRPEGGPPPARGPGAPAARGGRDPRPGTPPTARPDQGGRHEVLLSLAGRIDDDALSSVRELVAVEDDAAAAELLGGCLLAAGAGVTAREHAVLGRWFAASRVDPELVDVLPRDPEADRREEHRFTPDPPASARAPGSSRDAGEAVARAAARLPGVQRVRQCWRTTPAGSAPGPVPHRVVLVETHSADDCEHVAHHVAHAARELGAVSVEVFAAGAELPAYHRAAVRVARPLGAAAPSSSVSETAPLGPPVGAPRPSPGPAPRRADDEVPPFGVPVSAASAGPPSFLTVTGPDDADERRAAEPAPEERSGDEQYRIVAAAGPDPLERERGPGRTTSRPTPRSPRPRPSPRRSPPRSPRRSTSTRRRPRSASRPCGAPRRPTRSSPTSTPSPRGRRRRSGSASGQVRGPGRRRGSRSPVRRRPDRRSTRTPPPASSPPSPARRPRPPASTCPPRTASTCPGRTGRRASGVPGTAAARPGSSRRPSSTPRSHRPRRRAPTATTTGPSAPTPPGTR